MQKLYCYVDESGQDPSSRFFVVAVIVSASDQQMIREELEQLERVSGTGHKKWHKVRQKNRIAFLERALGEGIAHGLVYVAWYRKPALYFFTMLDAIEKAIRTSVQADYQARIYVDGIDQQKALELTSALRIRGISLRLIQGSRDESEPLIRLALLENKESSRLLDNARKKDYLRVIFES
ncbi:DUF3800 domain-containing protein [Candidatus Uhrbacteria bacterium]|nr:DUF3800 domain-containing protein [Candidatus Uhrbacteria bacterium]